jgi:hypothetical protein
MPAVSSKTLLKPWLEREALSWLSSPPSEIPEELAAEDADDESDAGAEAEVVEDGDDSGSDVCAKAL